MIKVLVADDHPVFRQGLVSILKDWGDFQVVGQAASGKEAISKTTELHPDIVIMDVRMPDVNGVEATAALRETMPQTKVLVLTVSEESADLFNAMKAGARGYLLKNAELDGLISAIRVVASGDVIITPTMAMRLMGELRSGNNGSSGDVNRLTPREKRIAQLVAEGGSNKEIAAELGVSETTVKAHLRSILEKLHVKNRAEAVAKAVSTGLLN